MILGLLLQVNTPEKTQMEQVVQSLSKSSIEMAEAASNYGALKVIFGVFMVFVILLIVMFIYTIWNLNKKIARISESSRNVSNFFEGIADHTIGTNEAQVMIRRTMNDMSCILKYYILRIRLENHISDKETVIKKIDRIINNEYSELCGFLSNYFCNNRPLSEIIDGKDNEAIKDFIVEQVYIPKEEFTIAAMDQSVNIFVNGIKQIYLKKI